MQVLNHFIFSFISSPSLLHTHHCKHQYPVLLIYHLHNIKQVVLCTLPLPPPPPHPPPLISRTLTRRLAVCLQKVQLLLVHQRGREPPLPHIGNTGEGKGEGEGVLVDCTNN